MTTALQRAKDALDHSDAAKGILAGIVGGLAGSFLMSRVQQRGPKVAKSSGDESSGDEFNSAARDALTAPFVHYAFGAAMGAMYGYYVETTGHRGLKTGARFGMSVWAAADEAASPALGLAAVERPAEVHAESFASHVVFGVTTEVVRRGVRAVLR